MGGGINPGYVSLCDIESSDSVAESTEVSVRSSSWEGRRDESDFGSVS